MNHDCVEVYLEMVGEIEELESKVFRLRDQDKVLTNFLVANFRDEVGVGDGDFETDVKTAIRLLEELKKRRALAATKGEGPLSTADIIKQAAAEGYAYKGGYDPPQRPWVTAWEGERKMKGEPDG